MRGLIRFKASAAFLIIGFCIASIMFNYSAGVEGSIYAEEDDKQLYAFIYGASVGVSAAPKAHYDRKQVKQDMLACIEGIEEEKDTLILIDCFSVYVNAAHINCPVEIYLSGPMPKYDFVKGGFPTEEMLSGDVRYVVLGAGRKRETYKKSGKDYILIQGEEYEVTGYVAAPNSGILSDTVMLFYGSLDSNIWDSLCEYYIGENFVINYMSDTNQTVETLMMDYLYALGANPKSDFAYVLESDVYKFLTSSGASKHNYASDAERMLKYKTFARLIYVFCVVSVMFILWLWMAQRQEEFYVRKAFGYSQLKLSAMVFVELLEMLFIAVILSELIRAVLAFTGREWYVFRIGDVYSRFLQEAEFMYITLILTGIIPFIKLRTKRPAVLLSKGKR